MIGPISVKTLWGPQKPECDRLWRLAEDAARAGQGVFIRVFYETNWMMHVEIAATQPKDPQ